MTSRSRTLSCTHASLSTSSSSSPGVVFVVAITRRHVDGFTARDDIRLKGQVLRSSGWRRSSRTSINLESAGTSSISQSTTPAASRRCCPRHGKCRRASFLSSADQVWTLSHPWFDGCHVESIPSAQNRDVQSSPISAMLRRGTKYQGLGQA